jgi:hypothetical protein
MVKIEKTEWLGWPNCYRIGNGLMELIVTSDVGPRIMRCGFEGGANLFKVYEDQAGKSGEPAWQLRGGHRLWIAPEHRALTYAPVYSPVAVEVQEDGLIATADTEPSTGIRKQLVVRMSATEAKAEVTHRYRNTLPFPIEFAAWAPTMMAQNGIAVTGFPPRGTHPENLEPSNPLIMWPFTDLRDPRWTFLRKYLVLRQDPSNSNPTKLGHFNVNTWAAYLLGSDLFVKRYSAAAGLEYPDMGCSYQTFTRDDMLEMETLGPITRVAPGEWLEHKEQWFLHGDISVQEWDESGLDRILLSIPGLFVG